MARFSRGAKLPAQNRGQATPQRCPGGTDRDLEGLPRRVREPAVCASGCSLRNSTGLHSVLAVSQVNDHLFHPTVVSGKFLPVISCSDINLLCRLCSEFARVGIDKFQRFRKKEIL